MTQIIKPQEGFQERFLSSEADIVIGGGSAGGGKTVALLLDLLHYVDLKGFGGVIFRRTTPQITSQGGLWDTSMEFYSLFGAKPTPSGNLWVFPEGTKLKFSHLEYEKDVLSWQGSQIAFIGFDELTHFSLKQFLYLMSRNRSLCNMKPCIRATCNPDPDSWVAEFIEWWIDQETGFPIPERDGVLRYFTRDSDQWVWGDTKQDVIDKCPHLFDKDEYEGMNIDDLVKSATFLRGDIYGNKKLLEKDPAYLANLNSLDEEEKAQLLDGNWKVKLDGLGLCEYQATVDLFSNYLEPYDFKCMTVDVAGFGKDLAVIYVWEGFKAVKIRILTKCSPPELLAAIEEERKSYKVPKSAVLCDEDGMGWGIVGNGYVGFKGNDTVAIDPDTKIKENYANFKTQCWYRFAKRINNRDVCVSLDNIVVDDVKTNFVTIKSVKYDVKKLIQQDLRSFKRVKIDHEGKKQMNNKEAQKNILKGRSPDNGDTIMMREYFEIFKPPDRYMSFL